MNTTAKFSYGQKVMIGAERGGPYRVDGVHRDEEGGFRYTLRNEGLPYGNRIRMLEEDLILAE